ncbi:hypothetical protein Tco_0627004 [Tanacetum coccineum]|uniref:Uncharacterized protein n=1 Tax=Tanacetum coccineum TaxID=301880 RepID=A0ABQ4WL47_9ASTR
MRIQFAYSIVYKIAARVDGSELTAETSNCKIWLKEVWVKSRLMLRLCHSIDFVQVDTMSRTFRSVCLPPANRNNALLWADNEGDKLKWRAELLDVIQNVPIDASIERVIPGN